MTDKEAMKLALDEFKHIKQWCLRSIGIGLVNEKVLASLEEALVADLSAPKQEQGEPVAWMDKENHDVIVSAKDWDNIDPLWYWMYQPLYTKPQQPSTIVRTWVELTDEQFQAIRNSLSRQEGWDGDGWDLALKEAIEAKLKEKNT